MIYQLSVLPSHAAFRDHNRTGVCFKTQTAGEDCPRRKPPCGLRTHRPGTSSCRAWAGVRNAAAASDRPCGTRPSREARTRVRYAHVPVLLRPHTPASARG